MRHMICRPLLLSALLLLGVLLPGAPLAAAEIKIVEKLPGGFEPGDSVEVKDPRFPAPFDPSWTDRVQFQRSEGRLVLRIDHDQLQLPQAEFPVTVEFEISSILADDARAVSQEELSVEYDPLHENGDTFIDQVVEIVPGAHVLKVEVVAVRDRNGPLSAAPANVAAEAHIVLTRYDRLADAAPAILSLQSAGDEIEITWSEVFGAEEYHLEWLHVDDYLRELGEPGEPGYLAYDFRFDATRVTTTSLSYRISAIFEQGYLLARVRAVGLGGPDFEHPVYGDWSSEGMERGAVVAYPENQRLRIAAAHEGDALNWQHITNFAEEGKRKESVSYFDGSLRNRQVVSRLNTQNEAIVGETIYDFQGRAAIQVLPTPTGQPQIELYRNYNQNLGGDPYSRDDFDADKGECEVSAGPMREEERGSANYYSSFNPDQSGMNAYIPHAGRFVAGVSQGGFPFTHIEFEPDNTGRIRRQGGVGPTHQLGSGHETKYFYGKPAQEHLDRLFGSEVGYNSHYKKNLVVDANGQASVSYLDQQGRVVATALAGVTPQNLESLGHTPESFTVNVLDNAPLEPGDTSLDSSFHHLATSGPDDRRHDFKYQLEQATFEADACPLCFECVYALQATVLDECGEVPERLDEDGPDLPFAATVGDVKHGETCQALEIPDLPDLDFALDFEVGKYNVHKRLAIVRDALDRYLDVYFADARCTRSLKDFVDDELARTDFSGCQPATDCPSSCARELGEGAGEAELAACIDDCERSDGCREVKWVLMGDVSPGGQYATYRIGADGKIVTDDEHSILDIGPNPDYKDLSGYQPGEVVIDGVVFAPQELTPEDFVSHWQPSWAETLLRLHPEQCLLGQQDRWCEGGAASLASERYERRMREVDTFEEAFAEGFFNPLGLTGGDLSGEQSLPPELSADVYNPNVDPLLPRPDPPSGGSSDWQEMLDFLTLYTLLPPDPDEPGFLTSAWGVAVGATACAESSTAEAMASCIAGYVFDLEADICTRDKLWLMFRALYLAKRQELDDDPFHGGATCAPPTLRAGKIRRIVTLQGQMADAGFGDVTRFDDDPRGLTTTAQTTAGGKLDDACPDQCESSAGYWLVELAGCEALSSTWDEDQEQLAGELAEICRVSCLAGFPNGQGRVPDGDPGTPAGYRDFTSAVAGVIGATSLSCNGELISSPLVYSGQPASLTSHGNLDTCACDDLLTTREAFEAARGSDELKAGVETLAEYFEFTHGYALAGLSSKLCACDDAFVETDPEGLPWSPDAVWPAAAAGALRSSGEFVPAELGCVACAGCELTGLASELRQAAIDAYGKPANDRESANLDRIVTRRLNQTLGLDLTTLDYLDFQEQCDRAAGDELVCQELTPEALDLESLLDQLSLRGELLDEPCLCQGPYRDAWVDELAPSADTGFPWGEPDARCDHTWTVGDASDGRLSATIAGGCCDLCELSLEFVEPPFDEGRGRFEDVVHFEKGTLRAAPAASGTNTTFLIDAVLAVGGGYVTTTLRGESCFPIAECTSDPGDLSLCNHPASDDLPVGDPRDRCETQLVNVAKTNALRAYEEYVRIFKEDFSQRYTAQCLGGAEESFTMEYQDDEYHYTLYYYDQAGNLVKTVPPEGVELLTEGLDADGRQDLFVATDSDRRTGRRTVFTTHRMATTYEYNSLNQLTYQHVPDHDDMERWDWQAVEVEPGRLGPGEHLHGAGFADAENGYVVTDDPDQPDRGTVYVTGDGGESWQRVGNLGRMDLHAVQALGASTLYAVGEGGSFLRSPDGGATWSLQAVGSATDLVDLSFQDELNGLAFARDGKVYNTGDGGDEWSPFADLVDVVGSLIEVTAADFSGLGGFAAVRVGDEGGVLRTQDGGANWSLPGRVRAPGLAAAASAGGTALAVGADGRLLARRASGQRWTVGKVGLGRSAQDDPVVDLSSVVFFDSQRGAVAGRSAFLRYTRDGGESWHDATIPAVASADIVALDAIDGKVVFAGLANGAVLRSTSYGESWSSLGASGLTDLRAIQAVSSTVAYAGGRDPQGRAAVHRYEGGWQAAFTGSPGTVIDVFIDHAQEAGAALLAGGRLFHLRNSAWSPAIDAPPGVVDLHFAAGTGYAIHGDGRLLKSADLGRRWASIANDVPLAPSRVVALHVGVGGEGFAVTGDGVLYWTPDVETPGSWQSQAGRIALPRLADVQALGAARAYAVGRDGTLVETRDGNDWTLVATGYANDLHALDFASENEGLVAGAGGMILEGTGVAAAPSWVRAQTPEPAVAITGLAVRDSGSYATGGGGLLLSRRATEPIWDKVALATTEDLNAVVSVGVTGAVLVGDGGVVADETGAALGGDFRTESLFATHNLGPVAWAVGADGAILRSDDAGGSWGPQASGTHQDLHGVYFVDPSEGYAVGDAGTVLRTTDGGGTWSVFNAGTADLTDVHFGTGATFGTPDPQVGVAVGRGGTIIKSSAGQVPSPTSNDLAAVYFVNDVGFAVGVDGTILKSVDSGSTWEQQVPEPGTNWVTWLTKPPVHRDLKDVYFRDYVTGYVLGDQGLLLKTINGGLSWTLEDTGGAPNGLRDLVFFDEHRALLSGTDGTCFLLEDLTDRFSTRFWYDHLGRLVASQNSKQFAHQFEDVDGRAHFSYTTYDPLGRIVEVGQLFSGEEPTVEILNGAGYPDNWSTAREQVTKTFYDEPMSQVVDEEFGPEGQENLRNRVASAAIYDDLDPGTDYYHATHYSYDIHGNVKTLIQDNQLLAEDFPSQRFKRIEYEYDLVSGNVNEVLYQEDELDAFYHRYEYDADNRIVAVETSRDKVIWDQDAAYEYYRHGPLGRTEIGENKVQGVDYAYTLQGWIKGVNADGLSPDRDMGRDGTAGQGHELVARDAFGYSLGYYEGDYRAIGSQGEDFLLARGADFLNERGDLFNGNIGNMLTSLTKPDRSFLDVQGGAYRYDQLNRLVRASFFQSSDQDDFAAASASGDYHVPAIRYDGNGNILNLERHGAGDFRLMDKMAYQYFEVAGRKKDNRLLHVNDGYVTADFEKDIEDQGVFDQRDEDTWNYRYDGVGNLVRDRQEEIREIGWNVYGKVRHVLRESGSEADDLEFRYDASGNRLAKIVKPEGTTVGNGGVDLREEWATTSYVRDASGNIISIYSSKPPTGGGGPGLPGVLRLTEQAIYGSSRVGLVNRNLDLTSFPPGGQSATHTVGKVQYELANHLGNVVATISDKNLVAGNVLADVTSVSAYYPFGALMPSRALFSSSYRYGFNGMERDDELKGDGNSYEFKARVYDPRIGRWLSYDPLAFSQYPLSSYQYTGNNPVYYIDKEGTTRRTHLVIVVKDAEGNSREIANDVKVDKDYIETVTKYHSISLGGGDGDYIGWITTDKYDVEITTKITISIDEAGEKTYSVEYSETRKYRPEWYERSYEGEGETQAGGFVFTSKSGGASPTKTKTQSDSEEREIGDLLTALGALGKGKISLIGKTSLGNKLPDKIKKVTGLVKKSLKIAENSKKNGNSPENSGVGSVAPNESDFILVPRFVETGDSIPMIIREDSLIIVDKNRQMKKVFKGDTIGFKQVVDVEFDTAPAQKKRSSPDSVDK